MFVAVDSDVLIQRVVVLAREIWKEHYTAIIGAEQVRYMLREFQDFEAIRDQTEKGMEYFLVTRGDTDVGYFAVAEEEEGLFLSKLYIKSCESGSGLGSQSLNFICDHWKAERIWLTVNRNNLDSIRFYQNRGFTICGEVVQDIGSGFVMDDYRMEWITGNEYS